MIFHVIYVTWQVFCCEAGIKLGGNTGALVPLGDGSLLYLYKKKEDEQNE